MKKEDSRIGICVEENEKMTGAQNIQLRIKGKPKEEGNKRTE